MSPDDLATLRDRLLTAPHGGVEFDALQRLHAVATAGDTRARDAIFAHARGTRGVHRAHAASLLAQLAGATPAPTLNPPLPDPTWPDLFTQLLADPLTAYWAIPALLHTRGPGAYPVVLAIARDPTARTELRAQAVKRLAQASRQRFDRDLPRDPGHWTPDQLRLDELAAWEAANFPVGPGYPPPPRDPALDHPSTPLERLAARLEARLTAQRAADFYPDDPACPAQRLVPADPSHLRALAGFWNLPTVYREFLTRFSPLRVAVNSDRFYNDGLHLYGAADLLNRQAGYAWSPDPAHRLPGWNPNHVVIADHAADPFVLDLTGSPAHDAPVLTAEHGTGRWDFEPVAPGFLAFLAELLK